MRVAGVLAQVPGRQEVLPVNQHVLDEVAYQLRRWADRVERGQFAALTLKSMVYRDDHGSAPRELTIVLPDTAIDGPHELLTYGSSA